MDEDLEKENAFKKLQKRLSSKKSAVDVLNEAPRSPSAALTSFSQQNLKGHPILHRSEPLSLDIDGEKLCYEEEQPMNFCSIQSDAEEPIEQPLGASELAGQATSAHKKESRFLEIPSDALSYKTAISSDGVKMYFPFDKFKYERLKLEEMSFGAHRNSLLDVSVHILLNELAKDAAFESRERSEVKMNQRLESQSSELFGEAHTETQQWVDKYQPKHYADLLTDEWLNLQIIKWLKHWDKCVFGKDIPDHIKDPFAKSFSRDKFQRPEKRIIMLAGPPGLGKTTLAHIVAAQCGYNVVEINASDERSGDTIKQKIINALENKRAFSSDPGAKSPFDDYLLASSSTPKFPNFISHKQKTYESKPNLVILDEIDGASGSNSSRGGDKSLVGFLVNLLKQDMYARNQSNQDTATAKNRSKKKKSKRKQILRPIICICNDPYALSLKPLRPLVQIYNVRKPSGGSLLKRLQSICDSEGVKIERGALNWWVERADGDFRSCLNGLEFIWKKNKKILNNSGASKKGKITLNYIKKLDMCSKDSQKSLFKVWEHIFEQRSGSEIGWSKESFIDYLVPKIESNGEYGMLMQGCFEYYLDMKFRDINGWGSNIIGFLEYVNLFDQINRHIYTGSVSSEGLYAFMPYTLAAAHYYCASSPSTGGNNANKMYGSQRSRFEFPRQEFEHRKEKQHMNSLLDNIFSHLSIELRLLVATRKDLIVKILPWVFNLLGLNIRSVNPNLLKQDEKLKLEKLVNLMVQFGLTYVQKKMESGQYVYDLEPPIDQLLQFSQKTSKTTLPASYTIRQNISTEIERAQYRIEEGKILKRGGIPKKQSSKPKDVSKNASAIPKDFFGRPIEVKQDKKEVKRTDMYPIMYKFHEGFSNAVRKRITIGELLFGRKMTK